MEGSRGVRKVQKAELKMGRYINQAGQGALIDWPTQSLLGW